MTVVDVLMRVVHSLFLFLAVAWILLVAVAEGVNAYRRRSARHLVNVYAIGYVLAAVTLLFVFVVSPETDGSSVGKIVFNRTMLSMALWTIAAHCFSRGLLLVLDLFSVPQTHPIRLKSEKMIERPSFGCVLVGCALGILYLPIAVPYVLLCLLETISQHVK